MENYIEVAGLLIDPDQLHSEKFQKELEKLPKEVLVDSLLRLASRVEDLEELNTRRFNSMMLRKKSIGGITVDA